MSNLKPAASRGGTPDALAALRRGGLRKARATSVIADMTANGAGEQEAERQQPERLHAVPAIEPEPLDDAPEATEAVAPAQTAEPGPAEPEFASAPTPVQPAPVQEAPAQYVPVQEAPVPAREQPQARPEEPVRLHQGTQGQAPAAPQPAPAQHAPASVQQRPPTPPVQYQDPAQYQQPVQYAPQAAQYSQPQQYAPAPQPAPEPVQPPKKVYRKTSFFQSKESGSRMRSAYLATRHLTGARTLSDFIVATMEREVEALEQRYNEGKPFDVDPDSVPRGRPLES